MDPKNGIVRLILERGKQMNAGSCLRVICASLALLVEVNHARAGEITNLASHAETLLQSGQHASAIDDLRRAMRLAQDQTPLSISKAIFVSEKPQAFGMYKGRESSVFTEGEPLLVYAEPIGVSWTKQDSGYFHSLLTVDFEIRSPTGDILTGKRDFGKFEFTSHVQNTDIMTWFTFRLTGIRPGEYVLGVIYHDKSNGKSTTLDIPFSIQQAPISSER